MINLLPNDLKEDRAFGRRNLTLRNYTVLLVLIGICSTAVMFFNSRLIAADENNLRSEISEKQAKVAELTKTQTELTKLAADLKTIDQLYDGEIIFSELIPKIGGLLPGGTVLNGLILAGGADDPINLEIDMERQELAAVFQQNLVNSDLFEAADIVSITSKGEGGPADRYLFSATISAKFSGDKKPTTKTQAAEQTDQNTSGASQ